MNCYKDKTFCADACADVTCKRNKKHVPDDTHGLPVAWASFKDGCEMYEEETK